jgi:hypothetical protein
MSIEQTLQSEVEESKRWLNTHRGKHLQKRSEEKN